jgi:hypothetical protein
MGRLLTWKFVCLVLTSSILGLATCCFFGRGSSFFAHGGLGVPVVDSLAAIWSVALVVLLPLKIFGIGRSREQFARRVPRDVDPRQMNALGEAVFYANYGSLPRWLYLTFVILAMLLVLLTVFCVTLGVIWSVLHGAAA